MKLLDVLRAALLCAAIVLSAKLFIVLDHFEKSVVAVRADIHQLAESSNQTMLTLNKAAAKVEQTSEEQRLYWKVISHDTARTIESANALIVNTDNSVNGILVPQIAHSLEHSEENVEQVTNQAAIALAHLDSSVQPVMKSLLATSKNIESASGDPAIQDSFQRLSYDLEQFGKMTADGAAMSADVRDKVHSLLHPKKQNFPTKALLFMLGRSAELAHIKAAFF